MFVSPAIYSKFILFETIILLFYFIKELHAFQIYNFKESSL